MNLETERLLIRPFAMGDLNAAHQLLDLDLQWAGPGVSLEQRRDQLQLHISLAGWNDTGRLYGYRAIMLKATGQLIGMCGFLPTLWSPQAKTLFWPQLFGRSATSASLYASVEIEVGYALSSRHRGQGYATEAVKALIAYAFGELRVERVLASTNRSNDASIKLMKRIGMRVASNPEHPESEWPGAPGVVGLVENDMR